MDLNLQRAIEDQGFAIMPSVFTHREVSKLTLDLNEACLTRSRAGIRHVMRNSVVAGVARDERLLAIVRCTLGGNPLPFRATLFDKSPESNWLVVWHQDTALPLLERREMAGWGPWSVKDNIIYARSPANALDQVLALRLHLDDSTADNGSLRVLAATHKSGVLTDEAISQIAKQIPHVDCFVPQGGVLAMKPLIIHASSKSRVEAPRRVLHIEYSSSSVLAEGMELAVA